MIILVGVESVGLQQPCFPELYVSILCNYKFYSAGSVETIIHHESHLPHTLRLAVDQTVNGMFCPSDLLVQVTVLLFDQLYYRSRPKYETKC